MYAIHASMTSYFGRSNYYTAHVIVYECMYLYVLVFYSLHSSNNRLEVVQWLIKNVEIDADSANYVLQWACG